jgi:1-acyl-sn-glycerol-3-phosphate acyltransferase
MGIVFKILRPLIWLTCRLLFRMRFIGVENIPTRGSCLIVPNHVTFVDPIWITIPFRRLIYYMAWDKPFEIPVLGSLMRAFGAFPLSLERIDPAAQRGARARLREGCALVIFPEGGRSKTGKVQPFKMGAFRLALTQGVPIIPVTIVGGYEVWPVGQLLPKLWGRISITYHPPILVERLPEGVSKSELRTLAHSLADKTRDRIAGTIGASSAEEESGGSSALETN